MSSFAVPNFNLPCRIWHRAGDRPDLYPPPDLSTICNLANGRVSHVIQTQTRKDPQRTVGASSSALFPSGTDIRDTSSGHKPDVVEIPSFSGRLYWVSYVDDIAKGFANEHRWAVLQKVFPDGFYLYSWPEPIP